MSFSLKACLLLLFVSATMGAVSRPRYGTNDIGNENMDLNDLTPPQDPAINTFPKQPVVPFVPNCVHPGYFRDPFNCGKFYYCDHSEALPSTYYCRQGLIFNEITETCDERSHVDC